MSTPTGATSEAIIVLPPLNMEPGSQDISSKVDHLELLKVKSGAMTLRSLTYGETFHPGVGPTVEATLLHVEQQRLIERSQKAQRFVIWDVGLGAAANALSAIDALKRGFATDRQAKIASSSDIPATPRIEIHSFDRTTASLEFALTNAAELLYLEGYESQAQTLLKCGYVEISENLIWHLHLGDFSTLVRDKRFGSPSAILYDPYSPKSNPEMWTLEHFSNLFQALDPNLGCLLTNYTRSTSMRVALLLAGFYVGVGVVSGEKAETTIASNQLSELQSPLTRDWLKRVQSSTNSAPLRSNSYSKSPISADDLCLLRRHPQFLH
jgi:tRNA U34 5-methylaminomethyl-2-thiouridine-forming methyltransferase MnmC